MSFDSRMPESSEADSIPLARRMLLTQKMVQDIAVASLHYIPGLAYIVVSLVYSPLMFIVREPMIKSVWIAHSLLLILVGVLYSYRAVTALRAQSALEMLLLKTLSDSFPTNEMIWADRLEEARQIIRRPPFLEALYKSSELAVWLVFATVVYLLARS